MAPAAVRPPPIGGVMVPTLITNTVVDGRTYEPHVQTNRYRDEEVYPHVQAERYRDKRYMDRKTDFSVVLSSSE